MKKFLTTLAIALAIVVPVLSTGGCAQLDAMGTSISEAVAPSSPEKLITAAANANTAAITVATSLLANHRITVVQAKGYRTMLKGAMDTIDDMGAVLVQCRGMTGSTAATSPDPCAIKVVDILSVALKNITTVKLALDAAK